MAGPERRSRFSRSHHSSLFLRAGVSGHRSRARTDVHRRTTGGAGSQAADGRARPVGLVLLEARPGWLQSRRRIWVAVAAANDKGRIRADRVVQLSRRVSSLARTRVTRARARSRAMVWRRGSGRWAACAIAAPLQFHAGGRCLRRFFGQRAGVRSRVCVFVHAHVQCRRAELQRTTTWNLGWRR